LGKDKKITPVVEGTARVNPEVPSVDKAVADQAAADQAAADQAAAEKAAADQAAADKSAVDKAENIFEYNGKKYSFSNRMPEKLKVYGRLYTKEELIINDDAMTSLIIGNSPFVKRI
jgi:hypothetical protein